MAGFAWLVAATTAAASAIVAATDPTGRERMAEILSPRPPRAQIADVGAAPSEDATSEEIARLRNETRLLALEKKALAIRLALLASEGDAATVTGSIPAEAAGGSSAEAPQARELADPSVMLSEVAGVPAAVRAREGAAGATFALHLDGVGSIEEAREVWGLIENRVPEALKGLTPLIAMDERDTSQLWLMAGSLDDDQSAGTRCALITLSGRDCAVTTREGRPLPMP
ncbi:hypothetical protein N177_0795 [Lutibaculum baratangense AMV1]|uniref:Secreted protein n=1 Tax=Lutibaculum baratangense AMV1 TaxID=631454 RepID=V4RKJ5_9HYPH|nr:hypothetical protein N177_0795 [Lutibaculum baratangense AMV1]